MDKKLDNIKIAFFDLDGVLSVPRYKNKNGKINCSVPDADWFSNNNLFDNTYEYCQPINAVKELLEFLQKNDAKLFVLTHETNSGAYFNKIDFVLKHYRKYFPEYRTILFVSKPEKKVDMMKLLCERYGFSKKECILVEDSYDTCILANNAGIQALHISELFA